MYAFLEKHLAYRFSDKSLLAQACRHSSFVNEHLEAGLHSNERLEFLGDAVLDLVVGHLLMERFADLPEGELSRIRARLVNEAQLAHLARALNLGEYLKLGRGEEQTGGREKDSILADGFEAIVAAIYLDGGFQVAFDFVKKRFVPLMKGTLSAPGNDYKTRLQELVQLKYKITPRYAIVGESGPDHDKIFIAEVCIGKRTIQGEGRSKKLAQQAAAQKALEKLEKGHG